MRRKDNKIVHVNPIKRFKLVKVKKRWVVKASVVGGLLVGFAIPLGAKESDTGLNQNTMEVQTAQAATVGVLNATDGTMYLHSWPNGTNVNASGTFADGTAIKPENVHIFRKDGTTDIDGGIVGKVEAIVIATNPNNAKEELRKIVNMTVIDGSSISASNATINAGEKVTSATVAATATNSWKEAINQTNIKVTNQDGTAFSTNKAGTFTALVKVASDGNIHVYKDLTTTVQITINDKSSLSATAATVSKGTALTPALFGVKAIDPRGNVMADSSITITDVNGNPVDTSTSGVKPVKITATDPVTGLSKTTNTTVTIAYTTKVTTRFVDETGKELNAAVTKSVLNGDFINVSLPRVPIEGYVVDATASTYSKTGSPTQTLTQLAGSLSKTNVSDTIAALKATKTAIGTSDDSIELVYHYIKNNTVLTGTDATVVVGTDLKNSQVVTKALNAKGVDVTKQVKISNFDINTVGKQVVTLSYYDPITMETATTTVNVTVIDKATFVQTFKNADGTTVAPDSPIKEFDAKLSNNVLGVTAPPAVAGKYIDLEKSRLVMGTGSANDALAFFGKTVSEVISA